MTVDYKKCSRLIIGVSCRQLPKIDVPGGDVFHCLKKSDDEFQKFGEAYFSFVEKGYVKAWKLHTAMTVNLVVPHGCVKVVVCDQTRFSETNGYINSFKLSPSNYCLLTIRPGLWFGFQGISNSANILLNIADIEHQPSEQQKAPIDFIEYDWSDEENLR